MLQFKNRKEGLIKSKQFQLVMPAPPLNTEEKFVAKQLEKKETAQKKAAEDDLEKQQAPEVELESPRDAESTEELDADEDMRHNYRHVDGETQTYGPRSLQYFEDYPLALLVQQRSPANVTAE